MWIAALMFLFCLLDEYFSPFLEIPLQCKTIKNKSRKHMFRQILEQGQFNPQNARAIREHRS